MTPTIHNLWPKEEPRPLYDFDGTKWNVIARDHHRTVLGVAETMEEALYHAVVLLHYVDDSGSHAKWEPLLKHLEPFAPGVNQEYVNHDLATESGL